jgi:UDP-N-acetylmuramoylalanine--D-glutamate ligase
MAFDLNKNIFWIGGGDDKGNDLSKINLDSDNLKRVFLIGSAAVKLLSLTPEVKKPLIFKSLTLALEAAYKAAKKAGGGSIVLSPGCSSHDQFDGYEERGDIFSKTALSLIEMKN